LVITESGNFGGARAPLVKKIYLDILGASGFIVEMVQNALLLKVNHDFLCMSFNSYGFFLNFDPFMGSKSPVLVENDHFLMN